MFAVIRCDPDGEDEIKSSAPDRLEKIEGGTEDRCGVGDVAEFSFIVTTLKNDESHEADDGHETDEDGPEGTHRVFFNFFSEDPHDPEDPKQCRWPAQDASDITEDEMGPVFSCGSLVF